jgi:uncharacterized phage protein gp47/JayE
MAIDKIGINGMTVQSLSDLTEFLSGQMQTIYGNDINIASDTPDGQMINIYCQMAEDLRELILNVNAGFDPDQATGTILDQRVALNGLIRKSGTYTFTDIEIVFNQGINLIGLDDQINISANKLTINPYTVKDSAGNKFYLAESQIITAPSYPITLSYSFRAANLGNIQTIANTINIPDSIFSAITSVNNPNSATIIGVNEELDANLKIRRRLSTALVATGFLDSLESGLQSLNGVTYASVYENTTASTDINGIPAYGIWAIVEGGNNADIANMIYSKRAGGTPMKGSETYSIIRNNGSTIIMKWDVPVLENLYIKFNCKLPNGFFDSNLMKSLIVDNVHFGVGSSAVGSMITSYVQSLNANYQISGMLVSNDNATWLEILIPTGLNYKFIASTSRITITSV